MASHSNRNFIRSPNSRGRGLNRGNNRQIHESSVDEGAFRRGLNMSPSTRMGANNRNRRASSNNRSRLERIQTRRSDASFPNICEFLHSPIDNLEINERQHDNKENETASSKVPKPNNNLGNIININTARGIQESRPLHIFQSQSPDDNLNVNTGAKKEDNCRNPVSYSLPNAELSLSPTRVTATSPNLCSLRLPFSSTISTLRRDKIPSASSHTPNTNSAPSTSKASELSEAVSSNQKTTVNESWINAPEFHPKTCGNTPAITLTGVEFDNFICKNVVDTGDCQQVPYCPYTHDGDLCTICNKKVLHPTDEEQRERHRQGCQFKGSHVNISALMAQSKDKTCGICFEVVVEKDTFDKRFGILNRCNHVFCLTCIRKWRQARNFENRVVKSCPSCRVSSEFVCPSNYFVDTKDEKDWLIKCYKEVLADKPCKYFKQGRGECPFGNKCFYLHALPDGTITDVGPPRRRPRPPREDRVFGFDLDQMILWDLHDFDPHWLYSLTEEFDDIAAFFSDSDDSDGIDF